MEKSRKYRRKLIEVSLPLNSINLGCQQEKNPFLKGHTRNIHFWWARRPLAVCRSIIFSSLIDDPSEWPEIFPNEIEQEKERKRLFKIIEKMAKWENINNEGIFSEVKIEIAKSISRNRGDILPEGQESISNYLKENGPKLFDPFCGGGSIPIESHRIGIVGNGSDLNPVAVLLTKSLIEFPSKFVGKESVNPKKSKKLNINNTTPDISGLADDIRYYGRYLQDLVERKIGELYPDIKINEKLIEKHPELNSYLGKDLKVNSWLWTRTIQCPNPSCSARTPLVRSFWLSMKKGNKIYAKPILDLEKKEVKYFEICNSGEPIEHTTDRTGARCLFCQTFIKKPQLREISKKNGIEEIPYAIVAEGNNEKIFLPFFRSEVVKIKRPIYDYLEQPITNDKRWFSPPLYGLYNYSDLYTSRQLTMLNEFSSSLLKVREKILSDAKSCDTDKKRLYEGGTGEEAYADAIIVYLSFGLSHLTRYSSTLCGWNNKNQNIAQVFGRQALPMVWDFAECNPFFGNLSFSSVLEWPVKAIENLPIGLTGEANQKDACNNKSNSKYIISTDPPYFDNIGYADLSDYFYIWLRNSLSKIIPSLFTTVLTPKSQELIASTHRHEGDKKRAQAFFLEGLKTALVNIRDMQEEAYPFTIYYAFKQTEETDGDDGNEFISSTGWEAILTGLIESGFCINGTWPFRTERDQGLKTGVNALASSIVLVCRPRPDDAKTVTRREFLSALKKELPQALHNLQQGLIAPVDLAQAAIGPGMAVFTRYAKVMESDGSAMTVRTALGIINQILDEVLAEQEGEFDTDTRWAVAWFEQHGMEEGPYGEAETLATAKNIAVQGLVDAGILNAKGGKVHLINRSEYPDNWDPTTDTRLPVWEATQHLIRTLENQGEQGAADLLNKLGGTVGDQARDLAYRLYAICERKKWSSEALAYNSLIISWPEISKLAQGSLTGTTGQQTL